MKGSSDMPYTIGYLCGEKRMTKVIHLPETCPQFHPLQKRTHFQAVLWRSLDAKPDQLNPEDFSWKRDADNKSLNPIALPDGAKPAPDYILEMI
jgi:hypothetical protein